MSRRAALVAALAAGAALALLIWSPWTRTTPAEPPAPPSAANSPATSSPEPHAAVGAPERIEATTTFAFRGRITDLQGRGLAGARVQRIDGEGIVGETTCGGDGAFLLGGAPVGRWSLRALADGFAPAQRGDLDASVADDGVLDVGDLPLRPATTYRGRVLSGGAALAGARVVVRTELRTNDTMVPLVRTLTTADDGWFFVADAPPPPVFVQALAAGHRPGQQRVDDAAAELRLELAPVPIVRGRVVSAATGAPLPDAFVLLLELQPGMELPAAPLPDFERLPPHRVRADGTFARELTRTPWALAVQAEGHVAQLLGTFTHADVAREHTIALQAGATVRCRVTGAAPGTMVLAELLREPTAVATVRRQGQGPGPDVLLLPPVPAGRWLLRVDGTYAARHERWLDLTTATVHDVEVALREGTRLRGHLRGGAIAGHEVLCQHEDGTQRTGTIDGDGAFEVRGLFAGRWRVLAIDRNEGMLAQWRSRLMFACGGTPIELVAGEVERTVDTLVPEAAFGRLRVTTRDTAVDRIRVQSLDTPPAGAPRRIPPGLLESGLRDEAGAFCLDPVLPGSWRLLVLAGERIVHQQDVVVAAGTWTEVTAPQ